MPSQSKKEKQHAEVLLEFNKDRRLAHEVLFAHRHPLETPEIHGDMIDAFHSQDKKVVIEAARGFAKSTLGEEATTIGAEYLDFMNGVIIGSTEDRAMERLESIKSELTTNDHLIELFGDQEGPLWQGRRVILQNGVCLQALGVGQKVRGLKYLQWRPDWVWFDDAEDDESVRTPEASLARLKWLYRTLLPICAKNARIRGTGNRLSPDAVITKLANDPSWKAYRFPIVHFDVMSGKETPTWPALHDMDWIVNTRDEYSRLGLDSEWASEYMCEASSESVKPFKVDDYKVFPRTRLWEPCFAAWDPARTASNVRHQSHYGKGIFSWIGRKLIVWDCLARPMMPSELIDDIFETDKDYRCVTLHVEKNGLDEWLMEPLRSEQIKRRVLLPHLEPLSAPKDKIAFIRSLEAFFRSGEIEFTKELPELRAHMQNFPSGRMDDLNVLAYALLLRPGQPMIDGFNHDCVSDQIDHSLMVPRHLILNADGSFVTGQLVQYDGTLSIMGDWIEAGDPGQHVERIVKQARILATGDVKVIVPPKEMDKFQNKGIVAALRRLPMDCDNGNTYLRGRAELRDLLARRTDRPMVQVHPDHASWTLRALSGGYHKKVNQQGQPEEEAHEGAYRTLMEGLESFAGIMHYEAEVAGIGDDVGNFRLGRSGHVYRSLIGNRQR